MRGKVEVKKENSDFVNSTGGGSYNFDNFTLIDNEFNKYLF